MSNKNENLEQLLQQFVDKAQANEMADSIEHADSIFAAHPAPSVPEKMISKIKEDVHYHLRQHKHTKIAWSSAVAVVASILIGLFILYVNRNGIQDTSLKLVQNQPLRMQSFYTSDVAMAEIEKEITHLYEDFESIDTAPYEPVNTLQIDLNQIENDLTADSAEFWKG